MRTPWECWPTSPDFPWQLTNLRNYTGVTSTQEEEAEWDFLKLVPFGQGAGTFSLPGGYTSPARFVRTVFLKTHVKIPDSRQKIVPECFHIMESVSIPKGTVMTARGTADYTAVYGIYGFAKRGLLRENL